VIMADQQQNGDEEQQTTATSGSFLDTKIIKSLSVFSGEIKDWNDWSFTLMTYIGGASPALRHAIKVAQAQTASPVLAGMSPQATAMAGELFVILVMQTKEKARRICRSSEEGNGFQAWRLLQTEYELVGPGKELLILIDIVSLKFSDALGETQDKVLCETT
jgi:hypothetical protein